MHVESRRAQIERQAHLVPAVLPVGSTEALRAQVPTPVQSHLASGGAANGTLGSQVRALVTQSSISILC